MSKSSFINRKRNDTILSLKATEETYRQLMVDTLILTLTDPRDMNNKPLSEDEINSLIDAWFSKYDSYKIAITNADEADYARVKMDENLLQVVSDKNGFIPFQERYPYIKEIKYK